MNQNKQQYIKSSIDMKQYKNYKIFNCIDYIPINKSNFWEFLWIKIYLYIDEGHLPWSEQKERITHIKSKT